MQPVDSTGGIDTAVALTSYSAGGTLAVVFERRLSWLSRARADRCVVDEWQPPARAATGEVSLVCRLEDQPHYLVPPPLLRRALRPDEVEALILHPGAWIPGAGEPAALPRGAEALGGGTRAWLRDPDTGAAAPFDLGPALRAALSRCAPGEPAPRELSPYECALGWAAGLLTTPSELRRDRDAAATARDEAARQFAASGHAALRGLLHPFHVAALRRYYRRLARTGGLSPERENPRRLIAHNDPVARFFHHQLTAVMTAVAGVPVAPSYAYVAAYQGGAALPIHTDRAQCEYSITLLIDFSPEPTGVTPWPLYLVTDGERRAVEQALGDALVYRGRRMAHYRDPLPDSMTSTSLLFHYVDHDFTGSLD